MSKNCKHTVPCGCEDQPISSPGPCPADAINCPVPDPCPETFSDQCLVHSGDTIVDLGITQGERLDVTLQRLTLFLTNPGCVTPGSGCLSVLGLKSTTVTSTEVSLAWLASSTAVNYQVEYELAATPGWTSGTLLAPSVLTDTITGLTPDTDYHFRVNAFCASGNCYSVTILVRTKSV